MDKKEQENTELKQEDLEQASGGTFNDNRYSDSEYASVGISVVSHLIARNEFWWNGQDIGHDNANMVVRFCKENGRQPSSLKEAFDYYLENIQKPGCDLFHMATH